MKPWHFRDLLPLIWPLSIVLEQQAISAVFGEALEVAGGSAVTTAGRACCGDFLKQSGEHLQLRELQPDVWNGTPPAHLAVFLFH